MYVQHVATIAGAAPAGLAALAAVAAGPAAATSTANVDALVGDWYVAEAPGLQRYVRSLVRDPDEAADVCQEAFVRLVVAVRAGNVPDSPGAWIHRVAHNLVVSEARRRRTGERAADRLAERDDAPSPEDSVVRRERDERLVAALRLVSDDDRTAMLLAAQGYRAREIGQRLGRTELATRALICRARGRLREAILAGEPA
jgi:RNA polymerase sigma-70 factor (ECF subfamily)